MDLHTSYSTVSFRMTLSDLAKYSMTRSVARSLCDSWASWFRCRCLALHVGWNYTSNDDTHALSRSNANVVDLSNFFVNRYAGSRPFWFKMHRNAFFGQISRVSGVGNGKWKEGNRENWLKRKLMNVRIKAVLDSRVNEGNLISK